MSALRRFDGHIVVVTGGGRGIGRATSLRFGAEGAHVVVADEAVTFADEVSAEILERGGSSESWGVDVADPSSVGRFFSEVGERWQRLDVLVNCPGHATDTPFERVTESEFVEDLSVTLKAPFLCIQAAIPYLLRSDRNPSVVSIGSVNGLRAFGNETYGAAKAGLINLTENLAIRYGPRGLRVNVVAPGTIATRLWDARVAEEPAILDRVTTLYPLRRLGTPEDVAAACLFLASSDASWITGHTLTVDGGITAGHGAFIDTVFGDAGPFAPGDR
ncbi:SDR family NAD(P)-dependent oxidoreductase [Sphaerisporangium krabiense]|uniref:NAD(P)-dependent dehydrogenase (Short-subunit alcohol dehydrogenase family) n=1 Tax=Sphaerisporangium krabiense TaxID=763782 RepID=A0A7W8Z0J8_9ACTN|nr:SDR family oxidoreductase [Sphaerisporangium krabiense]MBB5625242.1 NAD(P)-dependent dehydrogenase (short-subunit alcohol dehydrogenase family) [Sphaerisporangium krabiense]